MPSNDLLKILLPLMELEAIGPGRGVRPFCAYFTDEEMSITVLSSSDVFADLKDGDVVEFTVRRRNGARKRAKE